MLLTFHVNGEGKKSTRKPLIETEVTLMSVLVPARSDLKRKQ